MSVFMKDQVSPEYRVADLESGISMFYPQVTARQLIDAIDILTKEANQVLETVQRLP